MTITIKKKETLYITKKKKNVRKAACIKYGIDYCE